MTPEARKKAKVLGIAAAVVVVVVLAVVLPITLTHTRNSKGSKGAKGSKDTATSTPSNQSPGRDGNVGRAPDNSMTEVPPMMQVTPEGKARVAAAAAATRKPLPADFPIDAVFTWVSGDDPQWRATKARVYQQLYGKPYRETPRDPSRTTDGRDDLYFSIHSLTKFAPWVRRVWVLTAPGHRPPWMKLGTGRGAAAATTRVNGIRVTCVHHDVVFDPKCVNGPTFNSYSIEAQIPHIKAIAECFLMCNDDFMTGAPLARGDVFTATGTPVVTLRDVAHNVNRMQSMWGQHLRNLGQLAAQLGLPFVLPHHVAAPVRKSALAAVVKALRPAICSFHPFRTYSNFPVWYLALVVAPSVPYAPGFRAKYYDDGDDYVAAMTAAGPDWLSTHPHLFCINQDIHEGAKSWLDALLAS
jgi:hypothetical protein